MEPLSLLGEACAVGPLTYALLARAPLGALSAWGTGVNAALTAAYAAYLSAVASFGFDSVGLYFDPVHPNAGMADPAATAAGQAPLLWVGGLVVGGLVPLACALLARRRGADASASRAYAAVGLVCALAGALCLRCAFYAMGLDVFTLY